MVRIMHYLLSLDMRYSSMRALTHYDCHSDARTNMFVVNHFNRSFWSSLWLRVLH